MKKRLLTLTLLLAAMVSSVGAQTAIKTLDELNAIPEGSTGSYVLKKNIDASKKTWTPIKNFKGTFDGNGHTITISKNNSSSSDAESYGIFDVLYGTVKSLTVRGNVMHQGKNVGGVAGKMDQGARIENCSSGVIYDSSAQNLGGIAGSCENSSVITGCSGMGSIRADGTNKVVGGIVGSIINSEMTDCKNYSSIDAADKTWKGMIAGKREGGTVMDCLYMASTTGILAFGTETGSEDDAMSNVQSFTASQSGDIATAGQLKAIPANSRNNYRLIADIDAGDITPIVDFRGTFDGNGHTITYHATATGIEDNVGLFAKLYYGTVKNLTVKGSVTLKDGNSNHGNGSAGGIAGQLYDGKIENCISEVDVILTGEGGGEKAGGIAGFVLRSSITNCQSSGTITIEDKSHYVGGILGYTQASQWDKQSTITDCYFSGTIKGSTIGVGMITGIIGNGIYTNCTYDSANANGIRGVGGNPSYDTDDCHPYNPNISVDDPEDETPSDDQITEVDSWHRLYVAVSRAKPYIKLTKDVTLGEGTGNYVSYSLPEIAEGKEVTIDMNGYKINGNGDAHILNNRGTLTLKNGTVTGGNTTDNGAAIRNFGTLHLGQDVTITGNQSATGAIWQGGTMIVGSKVNVTGNNGIDGTTACNVYLASGKVIIVNSSLTNTVMGVTLADGTGVITSGYGEKVAAAEDAKAAKTFPSDNAAFLTGYSDGEARLVNAEGAITSVSTWSGFCEALANTDVQHIQLTADITNGVGGGDYVYSEPQAAGERELVIDLNGYNIDANSNNVRALVTGSVNVTLRNSGTADSSHGSIKGGVVRNNSVMTVEKGVTIADLYSKDIYDHTWYYGTDGSKLTIESGASIEVLTTYETIVTDANIGVLNTYGSVTINGGTAKTIRYNNGNLYLSGKLNIESLSGAKGKVVNITGDITGSQINVASDYSGFITSGLKKFNPSIRGTLDLAEIFKSDKWLLVFNGEEAQTAPSWTETLTADHKGDNETNEITARHYYIALNGHNYQNETFAVEDGGYLDVFNSANTTGGLDNSRISVEKGGTLLLEGNLKLGNMKTLSNEGTVTFLGNNTGTGTTFNISQNGIFNVYGALDLTPSKVTLGEGKTIDYITGDAKVQYLGETELRLAGAGAMADYASADAQPWRNLSTYTKSITAVAGMTRIGENAFRNFEKLEEVYIPSTVTSVAGTAFVGCEKVSRLIFNVDSPANLTWDNYEDSFWEAGGDMTVYVNKNYIDEWRAKFPFWFFEDKSSLNLDGEDDPDWDVTTGIRNVETTTVIRSDARYWYTIGGQRLSGQPTKPGLYINNGKKVVIK